MKYLVLFFSFFIFYNTSLSFELQGNYQMFEPEMVLDSLGNLYHSETNYDDLSGKCYTKYTIKFHNDSVKIFTATRIITEQGDTLSFASGPFFYYEGLVLKSRNNQFLLDLEFKGTHYGVSLKKYLVMRLEKKNGYWYLDGNRLYKSDDDIIEIHDDEIELDKGK